MPSKNLNIIMISEAKFQGSFLRVATYAFYNIDRAPSVGSHPNDGTSVYIRNGLNPH